MRQKLSTLRAKLNVAGKENKGFTLVELIVVIVILAILVGVTIGGVYGYVNKSRINTDINNASVITSTLSTATVNKAIGNATFAKVDATKILGSSDTTGLTGTQLAEKVLGSSASADQKKVIEDLFPDGIDVPKSGDYVLTVTVDDASGTGHIQTIKVVACEAGSTTTPLKGQE